MGTENFSQRNEDCAEVQWISKNLEKVGQELQKEGGNRGVLEGLEIWGRTRTQREGRKSAGTWENQTPRSLQ